MEPLRYKISDRKPPTSLLTAHYLIQILAKPTYILTIKFLSNTATALQSLLKNGIAHSEHNSLHLTHLKPNSQSMQKPLERAISHRHFLHYIKRGYRLFQAASATYLNQTQQLTIFQIFLVFRFFSTNLHKQTPSTKTKFAFRKSY